MNQPNGDEMKDDSNNEGTDLATQPAEEGDGQSCVKDELCDAIEALLNAEHCPNCPDQGWYADGPTDDLEQVQCEWCECHPKSLFKAQQKARAALAAVADKEK